VPPLPLLSLSTLSPLLLLLRDISPRIWIHVESKRERESMRGREGEREREYSDVKTSAC